jgi:uncharacterized membrane protein
MQTSKISQENQKIEEHLSRLLRIGIILAVGMIILGLVLFMLTNSAPIDYQIHDFDLVAYFTSHSLWDAVNIMILGIFMLIVTPIFRVIATIVTFAMYGDRLYVLFTVLVLIIIVLSIIVGFMVGA